MGGASGDAAARRCYIAIYAYARWERRSAERRHRDHAQHDQLHRLVVDRPGIQTAAPPVNPLRVLALLEATTVTGPAKNLIRFCQMVHADPAAGLSISIAAFHRRPPAGSESNAFAGSESNAFLDAVRAAGIELDVIPERGRFDSSILPVLREIVARRRPDIIQTHAPKSHFLVRRMGFHRGRSWIAFHHGDTAEDLKMRLYTQFDRWSLRAAHRSVTVCEPFADLLVARGVRRERIQIVPNAMAAASSVAQADIAALRDRLALPPAARVILSVGRLSPEKGHADLLAALRLLLRDHPQLAIRLILVGDGTERPSLERSAAAPDLTSSVIFAGHCANVWPYYSLADVFALPSHSEGSPNALLEAMAAGVPIVASKVGGVPETVEDDLSALLVPPSDPVAMASALARVLEDPALAARLVVNASERLKSCFSPESRYQALLDVYRSVQESL
jgi:glycosyltransferase involved in cell wall biosynthesis